MFDYKRYLLRLPAKCAVLLAVMGAIIGSVEFLSKHLGLQLTEKAFSMIWVLILMLSMYSKAGFNTKFWRWLNK